MLMRQGPSMEAARGFGQLGVVALFPYKQTQRCVAPIRSVGSPKDVSEE
jgi:hypothetical protein